MFKPIPEFRSVWQILIPDLMTYIIKVRRKESIQTCLKLERVKEESYCKLQYLDNKVLSLVWEILEKNASFCPESRRVRNLAKAL